MTRPAVKTPVKFSITGSQSNARLEILLDNDQVSLEKCQVYPFLSGISLHRLSENAVFNYGKFV